MSSRPAFFDFFIVENSCHLITRKCLKLQLYTAPLASAAPFPDGDNNAFTCTYNARDMTLENAAGLSQWSWPLVLAGDFGVCDGIPKKV